ncbi:MAG: TonB-dependent receptor [Bradyrhizobium sp.]|nr:TonB-dependent receptor [Bradyrhizobium sp.]
MSGAGLSRGGLSVIASRCALASVLAFVASPVAHAQAVDSANAQPATAPLGEIVVTAEHFKSTAQKTAIALTVYNGDELKKAGIADLAALSAIAPDLGFNVTEGKPIITIRGISSRDTTENGDPAVTVSTDGFYLNRPYSLNATMYDIDRVEVLRGPQGTLSGRNSVGGAIAVVTAKPTDRYEGYASLQYGNFNDLEAQGAINIPLNRVIQIRASFLSASHDGYRNNSPMGKSDDQDSKSGRIQIAFEPAPNLHGLITAEYTKLSGVGDGMQNIPYTYTSGGALDHDKPAGINSDAWPMRTMPYLDSIEKQIRGNLVYDIGGIEITALGGYDSTAWHHAVDQSNVVDVTAVPFQFQENQYPKTINAELRIASTAAGPLQWQLGAFYFREKSNLFAADAEPITSGFDYYFGFKYWTEARSKAVYGQASYKMSDALKISAGVRYTSDYKSEYGYYGDITGGVIYANQAGSETSSKPTFHVSVEDQVTSVNLIYAKFDTGYKAGGFNFGGSSYRPESVKSYEIGTKNRFLQNRLQLNLAAFYSDYTDQQTSNYTFLSTGQPVQLTQNAGVTHIYGVESDLVYKDPVIGTFNLSANYLHARYTYFLAVADPSDPAVSGNVQLAGNTPPQSPTWSIAAGFAHDWSVFGGTLTAKAQTKYQSAQNFSFYNYADTKQASYSMSDAFLSFRPENSNWSLTGFVKNIENRAVLTDAEESLYAGAYAYEFYPPRTFGVRIQYNWN